MNIKLSALFGIILFLTFVGLVHITAIAGGEPDLVATKTNDTIADQHDLGNPPFNWTITVNFNYGGNSATFNSTDTILTDDLPTGPTYGAPSVQNETGDFTSSNVSCAILSNTLTCTASSTINFNQSSSFEVTFSVDPQSHGTLTNPSSFGNCEVDPFDEIEESLEFNNDCIDSVEVQAADLFVSSKVDNTSSSVVGGGQFTWTIIIDDQGNSSAFFSNGDEVFRDTLPANLLSIDSATLTAENGATGTATCTTAQTVVCTATSGIDFAGGNLRVEITVTAPFINGVLTNPDGACTIDNSDSVPEQDETNNDCPTANVTVTTPDLNVNKFNSTNGETFFTDTFTWTISLTNIGGDSAVYTAGQRVLEDQLPAGATYSALNVQSSSIVRSASGNPIVGGVDCAIDLNNLLTCDAAAGGLTIPDTGNITVNFTVTPIIKSGPLTNPDGGICRVDPQNLIAESNDESRGADNNACSDSVLITPPLIKFGATQTISAKSRYDAGFWCGERKTEFTMDGVDFVNLEQYETEIEIVYPQKRILGIFPLPQERAFFAESATIVEPSNFLTPGAMTIPVRGRIEAGKTLRITCDEINTLPTRFTDQGDLDEFLSQVLSDVGYFHGNLTIDSTVADVRVFVTKIVRSWKGIDQGSGIDFVESQLDRDRFEIEGVGTNTNIEVDYRISQNQLAVSAARAQAMAKTSPITLKTYPNAISFHTQSSTTKHLSVEIYGLNGKRVFSSSTSGSRLHWRMSDEMGRPVANGVYLYVVSTRDEMGPLIRSEAKKVLVLR